MIITFQKWQIRLKQTWKILTTVTSGVASLHSTLFRFALNASCWLRGRPMGTAAVSVRKWRTRNAKVRAEWKLISSFGLLPQLLLPAGHIVNHTLNSVWIICHGYLVMYALSFYLRSCWWNYVRRLLKDVGGKRRLADQSRVCLGTSVIACTIPVVNVSPHLCWL